MFKQSGVQSEGDIRTARDHIKQHFSIWLQSKGAAGIRPKTIIFIRHYRYQLKFKSAFQWGFVSCLPGVMKGLGDGCVREKVLLTQEMKRKSFY